MVSWLKILEIVFSSRRTEQAISGNTSEYPGVLDAAPSCNVTVSCADYLAQSSQLDCHARRPAIVLKFYALNEARLRIVNVLSVLKTFGT